MSDVELLVAVVSAVGRLLDGPQDDKSDAMDELISAYDKAVTHQS